MGKPLIHPNWDKALDGITAGRTARLVVLRNGSEALVMIRKR